MKCWFTSMSQVSWKYDYCEKYTASWCFVFVYSTPNGNWKHFSIITAFCGQLTWFYEIYVHTYICKFIIHKILCLKFNVSQEVVILTIDSITLLHYKIRLGVLVIAELRKADEFASENTLVIVISDWVSVVLWFFLCWIYGPRVSWASTTSSCVNGWSFLPRVERSTFIEILTLSKANLASIPGVLLRILVINDLLKKLQ